MPIRQKNGWLYDGNRKVSGVFSVGGLYYILGLWSHYNRIICYDDAIALKYFIYITHMHDYILAINQIFDII
ncbi:MAG: hypothetical protein ACI4D4_06990, partial [Lachnospira sp.]